jgi:hypothetical protein
LISLAHGAAAAAWFWGMPKGFPVTHPRFWSNTLIPALLVAVGLAAFWTFRRRQRPVFALLCAVPAFMWIGVLVSGLLVFPRSASLFLVLVIATIIGLFGYSAWGLLGEDGRRGRLAITAVAAVLAGACLLVAQRGAAPGTKPIADALPPTDALREAHSDVQLDNKSTFQIDSGSVISRNGGVTVYIAPMLTFTSRSPDRCWTIFSPQHESQVCDGVTVASDGVGALYSGREKGFIGIRPSSAALEITAYRELAEPVYSHLNSYLEIYVTGVQKPRIVFSPCPASPIDILPSDYPTGRPARFAYLAGDSTLHIAEGSSGEKGPFSEMASGTLKAGEPVIFSILAGDEPVFGVVLDDWAAQASTQLSPTAGWGVPENAIEFVQTEDGAVFIYATLASTSVGRGWDSVGHAPGVYRNRMQIRWAEVVGDQ